MRKFNKADIEKVKKYLLDLKIKIKVKHIIITVITLIVGTVGFLYAKNIWKKYSVEKGANRIIEIVSQSQRQTKEKTGKYTNDLFADSQVVASLRLSSDITNEGGDSSEVLPNRGKRRRRFSESGNSPFRNSESPTEEDPDRNIAQSGNYYIEIDAKNGCMIVKYQRFTTEKTTFYAFFENAKPYCIGVNCKEQADDKNADLCYENGMCFPRILKHKTERVCGDKHGIQTRKCSKSCDGGVCEEWGPCVCNRGYGWDGKTCVQLQTEKDCNRQQCFNGVYCDYPDVLTKDIPNGTCKRKTTCQPNKGWQYTEWDCTCDKKYLCPVKDECVMMPKNVDILELPDGEGTCNNVSYRCDKGNGWKPMSSFCNCKKIGTFWEKRLGEAKCSPCTQKPENAVFTSVAEFTDSCTWQCLPGFDQRKGDCTKPDGQYLCARTNIQSCTDEFSKNRKMKIDTPTNEGQPCYTDMNDHILFFDKKYQICTICQCVTKIDKK